ncbi:hypothetical protein [Croceimicrobium sp.]|uniref:hypothetical protein n=1 Tax=Croceimicrobium sp. TaxID=2828340 RepID=UPI003BAA8D40
MLKKYGIHLIAISIFIALAAIFNAPVLSGKTIEQNDIMQYQGSSREIKEYRDKEDRQILWTNVIFSGMPSYMTSVIHDGEILKKIPSFINTILLDHSIGYIFMLMVGFYLLGISLNADPRVAMIGALAYGFSSYFIILLEAGHNAKIHAMVYLPAILAGMVWSYRRSKIFLGAGVFALFLSLELSARHPQMFYYFLFIAVPFGIYQGVKALMNKTLNQWIKASSLLIVGGLLALATNYPYLKSTLDFSKHTIRGKSELELNTGNATRGLDKDYITNWSYGIDESWTLLIPNFKGGKTGRIGDNETALDKVDNRFKQAISQQNSYYGDQPFTSGPVYAGAILVFLALMALIFYKGKLKYLFLAVFFLTLALSWGKNFMPLTDFFVDHFPYYNKFRAVSSMLVVPEFILPLLAILGLSTITQWSKSDWNQDLQIPIIGKRSKLKVFYIGSGALLLFLALNYVSPALFNTFLSNQEAETLPKALSEAGFNSDQSNLFMESLESARMGIFKADVLRSLFFILIGSALTWLFAQGQLRKNTYILGLGLLIVIDLFVVDKRYLNSDNFVKEQKLDENYGVKPTVADQFIIREYANDPYFRTLNLTVSPFNDATTSFYHYSLGGYHGAKLKIYQELIEHQLTNEIDIFRNALNSQQFSPNLFLQTPAMRMLNMRYAIINPNSQPIENTYRLGNAWAVQNIQSVESANDELFGLKNIDPSETAIMRKAFADKAGSLPANAGNAEIKLSSYDPEILEYNYQSATENLVVFSEIWYPEHWKVTIDGEPAELLRANYVLRALKVPAGKHDIKMEFTAVDNYKGIESVSLVSSVLILLLLPFSIYYQNKIS